MAQPSKFVSVNLNKSYGQPLIAGSSASGHGRPRTGGPAAGGSSGGMVVLSRPRSSGSTAPKSGAKLSVPPPLNLPSLRKEHERFDPSSAPGTSIGAIGSGSGSGTGSAGMRWTKPSSFQENDLVPVGSQKVGNERSFTPSGTHSIDPLTASEARIVEKAIVLRGEDFPSLLASFNSPHKQKDALSAKQKSKHLKEEQEVAGLKMGKSEPNLPFHVHNQMKSFRPEIGGAADGDSFGGVKLQQKPDGFLAGPLVTVRLSHTSDWADDERDTGLHIPERDKDRMHLRPDSFDHRVVHEVETSSRFPRSFLREDLIPRDSFVSKEGKDFNTWRTPLQRRDGFGSCDVSTDRDKFGMKSVGSIKENGRESIYGQFDNFDNGPCNGSQDARHGRREYFSGTSLQNGYEQGIQGRYGDFSSDQLRRDGLQNNARGSKGPFSSVSHKGFLSSDPSLDVGREKWSVSNGNNSYLESYSFDAGGTFSGDIIGDVNVRVLKKKDIPEQTNFRDLVRESFEAELERVQRIQEQERQRVLEEQERVLELARKEQEERERVFREEEQIRRQLEEEDRRSALKAEQEKLEAARRSEELKIAREEEKKRILMEEERRKEAARQKLLELEARIAQRKSESIAIDGSNETQPASDDEQASALVKKRDVPRLLNVKNYHDDHRVADRSDGSTLSNSSTASRSFDISSRSHSSRDVASSVERNKPESSWKRYALGGSLKFSAPDQRANFRSSNRDGFGPSKGLSKDYYAPSGLIHTKPFYKGAAVEPSSVDDWSANPDGDHFVPNKDLDTELHERNKYGDDGWDSGMACGRTHSPHRERLYLNSEVDSLPFSRSRHSMRQPRVLPPPSTSCRSYERNVPEPANSSIFASNVVGYHHTLHMDEQIQEPRSLNVMEENAHFLHKKEIDRLNCDSQSSLSVLSPPSSPTQPSHDDIDDSGTSLTLPSSPTQPSHDDLDDSGKSLTRPTSISDDQAGLSSNEEIVYTDDKNIVLTSHAAATVLDDDWSNDNKEVAKDQGVYEETFDEGDDENLPLAHEFENFETDVQSAEAKIGQMVFGYNEGVEVEISGSDGVDAAFMDCGQSIVDAGRVLIHDGIDDDNNNFHVENVYESSNAFSEVEKELSELVLDPVVVSTTEALSTFYVPVSHSVTPGLVMPVRLPVQPIISTASAVSSQIEVPVKLQFGLFSTPSLIPTPVPAIQIGSIQMPLQLHTQVETISQVQPSQRSLFQFGQLRYAPQPPPPPLIPPSISPSIQPHTAAQSSLNQNCEGIFSDQVSKDFTLSIDRQARHANKTLGFCQENLDYSKPNMNPDSFSNDSLKLSNQGSSSVYVENKPKPPSTSLAEKQRFGRAVGVKKNYRLVSSSKETNSYIYEDPSFLPRLSAGEKAVGRPKTHRISSGIRGRRNTCAVRNGGSRLPYSGLDALNIDSSGFQRRTRRSVCRTEFRVRGNTDRGQTEDVNTSNSLVHCDDSNASEGISRTMMLGFRKDATFSATAKMTFEKESSISNNSASQVFNSYENVGKTFQKEAESNVHVSPMRTPHVSEENLRRTSIFVEDMDSPIQSGVVRIFKQSGIETPTNEDDFIEVRSKRQILNNKREQREKEFKSKSKVIKAPHRQHTISQGGVPTAYSHRFVSSGGVAAASYSVGIDSVVSLGRGFTNVNPLLTGDATSLHLPPIGTSMSIVDSASRLDSVNCLKNNVSEICSVGDNIVQGSSTEMKSIVDSNVSTSFGSWGEADVNHQMISLTQSQLDDAMKPAIFDASAVTGGVLDSCMSPTFTVRQDKILSSENSLTSLLSEDKIQFGAMISPTVLPPVSRTTPHKIGPLGSKRTDVPAELVSSATSNNCNSFFDKETHSEVPRLEDHDAEAEAAASAVAVAAISSNDAVIGDRSSVTSISIAEGKSFVGAANQEMAGQQTIEEPLTVSLPADLSVDTTLSLWPPLLSPQSSSGSMLSHFPGALGSHFPCLDVNHVLGAPILSFGPREESAVSSQSQPQRGSIQGSEQPIGWAQCHSGVDSFYGPPARFCSPFINPGGISRSPPHMVFYNHFSPVGQYGQVGLGFMGVTYMPAAKPPDWKHSSVSAGPGVGESGEVNNTTSVPFQHDPPNVSAPIQPLSPGNLVPMASPVALFDMSPFKSSGETVLGARWPQIPAPPSLPVHTVPLNMSPLLAQQHQIETGISPHFQPHNASTAVGNNSRGNHFNVPHLTRQAEGNKDLLSVSDLASWFPDELMMGAAQPSSVGDPMVQTHRTLRMKGIGEAKSRRKSEADDGNENHSMSTGLTTLQPHPSPTLSGPPPPPHQQHRVIGSGDQRAGSQQRMGVVGGEWQRRFGFHGRSQSSSGSENHPSKVKQIYVAKQTSVTGPASTS